MPPHRIEKPQTSESMMLFGSVELADSTLSLEEQRFEGFAIGSCGFQWLTVRWLGFQRK